MSSREGGDDLNSNQVACVKINVRVFKRKSARQGIVAVKKRGLVKIMKAVAAAADNSNTDLLW